MEPQRAKLETDSPTSVAWQRYYEDAARRRGSRGDLDHKRLRQARKLRRKIERVVIIASVLGVGLLAWVFDVLLSR